MRSASNAAASTTSPPDLHIIPFCSFNVIPEAYRDKIQQKYGLPVEAWEAKNGKKLEDGLYRGTLRRSGHPPVHLLIGAEPSQVYMTRD